MCNVDVGAGRCGRTRRTENRVAAQYWRKRVLMIGATDQHGHNKPDCQPDGGCYRLGTTGNPHCQELLSHDQVSIFAEVQLDAGEQMLTQNRTTCTAESQRAETASLGSTHQTQLTLGSWVQTADQYFNHFQTWQTQPAVQ